jgi:ribonuclease R
VRQAIERQVLMVQRRSIFSTDAGLHSALGVNPYARFSAPMREIVGIFTHKEAIEAEFDTPPALDREANAALRQRVIESSNYARNIQREVDKAIDSCAIDHAIRDDFKVNPAKRPHRRGTILGMKPSALYVRLDMPPIELKVYIRDIIDATGENWTLNDEMTVFSNDAKTKQYIVGDSIELVVSSYQADKKKWHVLPV